MILMSKTIFQCSFKDHMHYIHQEENDAHPVVDEAIVTLEPVSHTGLNIYTIRGKYPWKQLLLSH